MNLWKRLARLIKLRLRRRKPAPDPLQVVNQSLHFLDERLQNVQRKSLELGKSKIQLEHRLHDLTKTINSYQEQAREALKLGREDLAVLALRNKHSAQQTRDQLQGRVTTLARQIEESKRAKEELINQIRIFKIKRDELELTRSAAQAQLSLEEQRLGLDQQENLAGLQEAFHRLETEITQIQAEVDATRELGASPLPPLTASRQEVQLPVDVAQDLERLKQEMGGFQPRGG